MAIKITHIDSMNNTTTVIECENINTLKELGYIRITPKLSTSAENVYFGQFKRGIDIRVCQKYVECVECPQFIGCNHLED